MRRCSVAIVLALIACKDEPPRLDRSPAPTATVTATITATATATTVAASKKICDLRETKSICTEYDPARGLLADETKLSGSPALLVRGCTEEGGAWKDAPCPQESAVGTCTLPPSTGAVHTYYSTGKTPYDVTKARAKCGVVATTVFAPIPQKR
jgi:hypothetical protein